MDVPVGKLPNLKLNLKTLRTFIARATFIQTKVWLKKCKSVTDGKSG